MRQLIRLTASLILLPALLLAEAPQIVIVDTSNVVHFVAEGDNLPVTFQAKSETNNTPAHGNEVTLRNADTGETFTQTWVQGSAVFESVPAGTWQVASDGVVFVDVAVGTTTAFAGAAAAAGGIGGVSSSAVAAGGLVAAGGAAAVAAHNSRGSSNDDGGNNSVFPSPPEELSPSS